jgi:hypothetical protein
MYRRTVNESVSVGKREVGLTYRDMFVEGTIEFEVAEYLVFVL